MKETLPEAKMLGLLQYLCKANVELLLKIVYQLVEHTTTAGQELLRYAATNISCIYLCTVKPLYNGHPWDRSKWLL